MKTPFKLNITLTQITSKDGKPTIGLEDENNLVFPSMHYNICEVSASLVTPLSGVFFNNILSCTLGAISITYGNVKLIILLIPMS
jgi:hypothetical protein